MHTQLTSSGAGWGAGSLDEDAEELNLLARYLRQHFGSTARLPRSSPCSLRSVQDQHEVVLTAKLYAAMACACPPAAFVHGIEKLCQLTPADILRAGHRDHGPQHRVRPRYLAHTRRVLFRALGVPEPLVQDLRGAAALNRATF